MSAAVTVVGLGPAGLDRVPAPIRDLLADPATRVVLRTAVHPAAAELAARRDVITGDDLYESAGDFDAVYAGLVERVLAAAADGPVAYAVPGSPLVGERSVALLRVAAAERGIDVEVVPAESFVDVALGRLGYDPLERGLQVLDARRLPDPLPLHLPTLISQVDQPLVLADVAAVLGRTLVDDTPITVLSGLGGPGEEVAEVPIADLTGVAVGPRTTLFLDPPLTGWHGLVRVNRRLRAECPWDREQTHATLVKHLVEEAYELVEVLSELPPEAPAGEPDFGVYAEVEEELGDLLLQVVFHATLAAEVGAFDVEEVAEGIRRKLVHRHPHVFGDVEAGDAHRVLRNWELQKHEDKDRESLMDGVPASLPALARAMKFQERAASVGFDWSDPADVMEKVAEEVGELRQDLDDLARADHELGDLLFSVVNLARHLRTDPEMALRRAADRFAARFRTMEQTLSPADMKSMTLAQLDEHWDAAKAAE